MLSAIYRFLKDAVCWNFVPVHLCWADFDDYHEVTQVRILWGDEKLTTVGFNQIALIILENPFSQCTLQRLNQLCYVERFYNDLNDHVIKAFLKIESRPWPNRKGHWRSSHTAQTTLKKERNWPSSVCCLILLAPYGCVLHLLTFLL